MRIIFSIDWNFLIENGVLEGYILLMEGEGSGEHKFKKPTFPHNQGHKASEALTGEKRQVDQSSSDQSVAYIRDDGTEISSKNPVDWGINTKHDFTSNHNTYKTHCNQMANLLEFYNKVHRHVYVSTCYDLNPFLDHKSTEFFESFTESRNIPCAPQSDKISNTVELRNLFRNEGNKK